MQDADRSERKGPLSSEALEQDAADVGADDARPAPGSDTHLPASEADVLGGTEADASDGGGERLVERQLTQLPPG